MNERSASRCLLYADLAGRVRLAEKLGDAEAGYAVERCLNRMSRSAEAFSATALELRAEVLVARFGDADLALQAARDMRERVRALPPMRGIKLVLRAGVVLESEAAGADGVEVLAQRLVEACNPDTITVSDTLSDVLSSSMRRLLGRAEAPPVASAQPPAVADLVNQPVVVTSNEMRQEASSSVASVAAMLDAAPVVPQASAGPQMRVSFRGQKWVIDAAHPTLLFGRETGNDIVVSDPRVSRQHARIELRNGQFFLADSSTNGTYLLEEGVAEHCIKRSEFSLSEKGHIGCGFSVGDNMSDAVAFAID